MTTLQILHVPGLESPFLQHRPARALWLVDFLFWPPVMGLLRRGTTAHNIGEHV